MRTFHTLLHRNLEPELVRIECSMLFQLPQLSIIGLPGPEISESKDRIRSAFVQCGFHWPQKKIILNLIPGNIRKQGKGFDLAMALCILDQAELLPEDFPQGTFLVSGELRLNGEVASAGRTTRVLYAAQKYKLDHVIFSKEDFPEIEKKISILNDSLSSRLFFISHFKQTTELTLNNSIQLLPSTPLSKKTSIPDLPIPAPEIQEVLEFACAGHHHFLLLGSRGAGKTHSLEWLKHLLPQDPGIELHQTLIQELKESETLFHPIRKISPRVKAEALIGSSSLHGVQPGEFTLAHHGVLIADEFLEWPRDAREALRDPLESGKVQITRASGSYELPADFLFAGTANLCPCGGVSRPPESAYEKACSCPPAIKDAYLRKLSGPIMDRLDIVRVIDSVDSTPSPLPATFDREGWREKIEKSRAFQLRHLGTPAGKLSSADLEYWIKAHPKVPIPASSLRDRHKRLRLALTAASLEGRLNPSDQDWKRIDRFRTASW